MTPTTRTTRKPQRGKPAKGALPSHPLLAITAREWVEAVAFVVGGFVGGVVLARVVGGAGWPRLGGYLGGWMIAALIIYPLGVYGFRVAPRVAWRRALIGASSIMGVMAAIDVMKAALG